MFKKLTLVCALVAGICQPLAANAQEFPKKQPIKLVVSSSPGGLTDVLARITAEYLQRRIGQAVFVENKVGAGGTIGADYVAKSPADGYTIFLTATELGVVPAVRNNLPYKIEDFTYLMRSFSLYPLLLASPKFPVNTPAELVSYMKANPGKARYGSSGVGAVVHMGTAMFEAAAGVKGTHVPYAGVAPVYQDMLAGNIDFLDGGSNPFPDGLKVLASVGSKRSPAYPNVPTLEESGIKGATWDVWFGFIAPPKLPKPIADKLIADISAVLKDPEAIAKYQASTKLAPDTAPIVGEDFKKKVLDENKGWKEIVVREKIEVQQ